MEQNYFENKEERQNITNLRLACLSSVWEASCVKTLCQHCLINYKLNTGEKFGTLEVKSSQGNMPVACWIV